MTAEEEEDVIKIDQANIAPCDTPALACVAFVACVILSSNTLARSSKILRWTLNLLDSSRLSGTCRTYRTLIQDLYVLNILESDTSLKAFEAAMFAHFFLWCSQAVPHRHIVARWQVEVDPAEVEVSEPEPPPMLVQSQSHRNQCHLETCDEMWLHMIWIATNTLYVRIHNYITLHYITLHYIPLHCVIHIHAYTHSQRKLGSNLPSYGQIELWYITSQNNTSTQGGVGTCGSDDLGKWRRREVVTKGMRWLWEVATEGSVDLGKWWLWEVVWWLSHGCMNVRVVLQNAL